MKALIHDPYFGCVSIRKQTPRLKYDGKWPEELGGERQWTLKSEYIDENGFDRRGGSFTLDGLKKIRVVPSVGTRGGSKL